MCMVHDVFALKMFVRCVFNVCIHVCYKAATAQSMLSRLLCRLSKMHLLQAMCALELVELRDVFAIGILRGHLLVDEALPLVPLGFALVLWSASVGPSCARSIRRDRACPAWEPW